jgi:ubiquinone biosynthesis protein
MMSPSSGATARAVATFCAALLSAVRLGYLVALHGLHHAVRRALLPRDAPASELGRLRGRSLAALLERLGPTYVKLGQVLATRPDLLGPAMASGLARLQEHVRPLPSRIAMRALRDGLGREPAEVFALVSPHPLASGSIAQVHRAVTCDGRHVALKIRRPGIARRLAADVRLLVAIATLLERAGLRFPIRPWIRQLTDAIAAQLDLAREAASYRELRANLAGIPGIRLPVVLPELTTSSVLTMELLDDLHHIDTQLLPLDDRRRALHAGLGALYHMIFVDGFLHADLHPGNVFFRRGGQCVLLDAGVVAHLDPAVRLDFIDFFLGLVDNRGDDCARIIHDHALHRAPTADRDAFIADVRAAVARFSALPASEFEVAAFAMALFDLQHRHRIYGAPDFMMAIVALLAYEGIVKRVQPDLDFQAIARHMLPAARVRAVAQANAQAQAKAQETSDHAAPQGQ